MNSEAKNLSGAGANTAGHTAGPWEQCDAFGARPDGTCVKAVADGWMICSCTGYYGRDVALANACLIAAAPDLLAALRFIDSELSEYLELMPADETSRGLRNRARAAIARAEGKA